MTQRKASETLTLDKLTTFASRDSGNVDRVGLTVPPDL